ncbi:YebC/PmpR family DNA-binding transcriptional regulator [Patescibacteria group bacterium]
MSGHSKWSTIKHKKAATDAKKGKVFSEISKMIRIAVKQGKSGDPDQNPSLRVAMDKARQANMPKDNVQRAVDRGLGVGKGGQIEEVLYEGFGPGGIGFMVVALTDNRQRTGAEVRHLFDKNGGSLGGPGSVSYMFERSGNDITVKVPMPSTDDIKEKVEKMAELLEEHDDVEEVVTNAS